MTIEHSIFEDVKRWGNFQGKKEFLRYLEGSKLSRAQSMKAKCCDCMGGYPDGAMDCMLDRCPMYDFMPYRGRELTKTQEKKKVKGKLVKAKK